MNRYNNIPLLPTQDGTLYNRNVIFPRITPKSSDIYVITSAGDRFDTLALEYYQNPTLWWIIAGTNNIKKDSLTIKPGVQLRIPMDIEQVLLEFNEVNRER